MTSEVEQVATGNAQSIQSLHNAQLQPSRNEVFQLGSSADFIHADQVPLQPLSDDVFQLGSSADFISIDQIPLQPHSDEVFQLGSSANFSSNNQISTFESMQLADFTPLTTQYPRRMEYAGQQLPEVSARRLCPNSSHLNTPHFVPF